MGTLSIPDELGNPLVSITRQPTGYSVDVGGWLKVTLDLAGRVLETEASVDVHPLDLQSAIAQTITPRVGQLVGRSNLHASAVEIEGKAVAFQGLSGSGKSTLAALLVERGGRLLTDDALALEPGPTVCIAKPSHPVSRLTPESAAVLGGALGPGTPGSEKVSFEVPGASTPVPLHRIYLLGGRAPVPTIEPLRQRDAMLEIAKHLHRMDPSDAKLLGLELDFLETVTRVVRVARLSHSRNFEDRSTLVDAILHDLEEPR